MNRQCLVIVAVLALAACSSGGGTTAQSSGTAPVRRGGQNLITAEEIAATGGGIENALDAVQRLRPAMLRPRSSTFQSGNQPSQIPVLVYTDEVKLGGAENLRTIPISQVREIRYISATDATQRWGTGHSSGVIQVIIRR